MLKIQQLKPAATNKYMRQIIQQQIKDIQNEREVK